MSEGLATVYLHTAYRVLQDDFPLGVAPESKEELARFRSRFYEASLEDGAAAPDFTDEQLASILVGVGVCFLGRVVSTSRYVALERMKANAYSTFKTAVFPRWAETTASDSCRDLFLVRSIYPKSAIFYPRTFLSRYWETLRAFKVRDVESLSRIVRKLDAFDRYDGETPYFANGDGSELELVTTTLHNRAVELVQKNGGSNPISFVTLLQGVYIPLETVWNAIEAEGAPFRRAPEGGVLPLDSNGDPVAPTNVSSNSPNFFDPQPDIAPDDQIAALFNAYFRAVPQTENEAPVSAFLYYDRLTGATIPQDRETTDLILKTPFRLEACDEAIPESSDGDSEKNALEESVASSVDATEDARFEPESEPASEPESEPEAESESEPESEPESIGELVDRIFRDGNTIVFYSTLFKRYPELFEREGVDPYRVRSALKAARPQYNYDNLYATPTKSTLCEQELVMSVMLLKWGDLRQALAYKDFTERIFIPLVSIREVLDGFSDVFVVGADDKVRLSEKLIEKTERIFDDVADVQITGVFDVVFYSTLFNHNLSVFSALGIASPEELRQAILDRGLEINDFGEYFTYVSDASIPKDTLILNALRAVGLLLLIGWRMDRAKARKSSRSLLQKIMDSRRELPPKLKIERLLKSGRFFVPEEEVVRVFKEHPEFFKSEPKGEWSLLSQDGKASSFWTDDELQVELDRFMDDVDSVAGFTIDEIAHPDRKDGDAERDETDASEANESAPLDEGAEAYEELGRLVDELFLVDSQVVLYFSVLFERHEELMRSLGLASAQEVRDAIRRVRPQYNVQIRFVSESGTSGVESLELMRRGIVRRWGDNSSTTVKKLVETLYAPKIEIQRALETYPSLFKHVERDAYILTLQVYEDAVSHPKGARPASESATALGDAKQRCLRVGINSDDVSKLLYNGPWRQIRQEYLKWEGLRSGGAKQDAVKPAQSEPAPRPSDALPEPCDQPGSETPTPAILEPVKREKPAVASPQPPKLSPRERLQELVGEIVRSGQLIVYYHTLLERNAELAEEYADKTALRAALTELFPSFGYADSYFEPRRRSAKESEDTKIRRSLLLCWGDAVQQRLDSLASRLCIPSTSIERTLKSSSEDFGDKGRSRFVIKEKAREESNRLKEYSAKLLEDLKTTLEPEGSYLFYETYYDANAEWLDEMGIDSVSLLRRELANLNKDAALGYVFYRNHCERSANALGENEFVRRLVQARFSAETRLRVDRLAETLRVPATLIRSALDASPDYAIEGGDSYRRV